MASNDNGDDKPNEKKNSDDHAPLIIYAIYGISLWFNGISLNGHNFTASEQIVILSCTNVSRGLIQIVFFLFWWFLVRFGPVLSVIFVSIPRSKWAVTVCFVFVLLLLVHFLGVANESHISKNYYRILSFIELKKKIEKKHLIRN